MTIEADEVDVLVEIVEVETVAKTKGMGVVDVLVLLAELEVDT